MTTMIMVLNSILKDDDDGGAKQCPPGCLCSSTFTHAYADHSTERDLHGPQRLVGRQDVDDAGEADDVGYGEETLGHIGRIPLPPVAAIWTQRTSWSLLTDKTDGVCSKEKGKLNFSSKAVGRRVREKEKIKRFKKRKKRRKYGF